VALLKCCARNARNGPDVEMTPAHGRWRLVLLRHAIAWTGSAGPSRHAVRWTVTEVLRRAIQDGVLGKTTPGTGAEVVSWSEGFAGQQVSGLWQCAKRRAPADSIGLGATFATTSHPRRGK
jgi:hypothetical protein